MTLKEVEGGTRTGKPYITVRGPTHSTTEPAGMRPRPRSANPERAALGWVASGRPAERGQNVLRQTRDVSGATALSADDGLPHGSSNQEIRYEGRPRLGRLPTDTVETRMDDEIQGVRGVLIGVLIGALLWTAMYFAIFIF